MAERPRIQPDDKIIHFHNDEGYHLATVHEGILRGSTTYFTTMIEDGQQGHPCVHVELKIDDTCLTDSIHTFVFWLYNSSLQSDDMIDRGNDPLGHLLGCYSFGHTIGNVNFMDATLDAIVDLFEGPDEIILRYNNKSCMDRLPDGTFVIPLIANWVIYRCKNNTLLEGLKYFGQLTDKHGELFKEVAFTLAEIQDRGIPIKREDAPYHRDRCSYHMHTEKGLPCYKQR